VTCTFTIPNTTEYGILQRFADFSVSRSSATCLHQMQSETGAVEDKGSLCMLLFSAYVALKMKLNSRSWRHAGS